MSFTIKCWMKIPCLPTEGKMTKKNKFELRGAFKLSAFFLTIVLAAAACKKEEGDLGLLVQPQDDQLNVFITDTSSIVAYTVIEDSLRSDEFGTSLLGSYVDPVFGKTETGIYAQLRMESETVDFTSVSGTALETIVDSMYLYLTLDGYYGNLDQQRFEIYQVTEDFFIDSNYYSNKVLTNAGVDLVGIGEGVITPDPLNNGSIEGAEVDPILKIKIDNTLGDAIVAESGGVNLADNDAFVAWFKGLYIKVNNSGQATGEGAILEVDLLNTNSKLSMYYRYTFAGEEDTLKFDFNINSSSARFTVSSHDYTGTPIATQILDSTEGINTVYVQTMSGVKSKIEFPFLSSLPDSIVVNQAELVLPFDYFSGDPYTAQDALLVLGIDDDGETYFIDDFFEGETIHGGLIDVSESEYRINIAKHVNNVLGGSVSNNGLFLLSSSAMISAKRAVINGTSSSNRKKMELIITYTKL
ncbi:MAG: hypothetical protein ACI9J3_000650 [Parvicellaceae bacterium]|jgi:hypothetical protein